MANSDVLVIGTVAYDSIKNSCGSAERVLGGAGSYAGLSSSYFAKTSLVSVVGRDFQDKYIKLFKKRGLDISGLASADGKTFFWAGSYDKDFKNAVTEATELNVSEGFKPILSPSQKKVKAVFLANIDPSLQDHVLRQLEGPKLVALDSMNYWIRFSLTSLKKILKKVDVFFVSEEEARSLTNEYDLIKAGRKILKMGPKHVVIKLGPNGVMFVSPLGLLQLPPYLTENIKDTTGAGDTFGGSFVGYLSKQKDWQDIKNIKEALVIANVMASFNIESFSVNRLSSLSALQINERVKAYKKMISF